METNDEEHDNRLCPVSLCPCFRQKKDRLELNEGFFCIAPFVAADTAEVPVTRSLSGKGGSDIGLYGYVSQYGLSNVSVGEVLHL